MFKQNDKKVPTLRLEFARHLEGQKLGESTLQGRQTGIAAASFG
jgi:hypothetical protein